MSESYLNYPFNIMLITAIVILTLSIITCLIKLVTTKSDTDKVIVIDIASYQLLGLAIMLAIYDQSSVPLQFAFLLSILGFISTIILSRLIKT